MTKEKMTLEIRLRPTKNPCETCNMEPCIETEADCPLLIERCEKTIYKKYDFKEAVEVLAKGLFRIGNAFSPDIKFEDLREDKRLVYKMFAEAGISALLGRYK